MFAFYCIFQQSYKNIILAGKTATATINNIDQIVKLI